MERPDRLIHRLRGGCNLSIQEEFDLYLYIKYLESELSDRGQKHDDFDKEK